MKKKLFWLVPSVFVLAFLVVWLIGGKEPTINSSQQMTDIRGDVVKLESKKPTVLFFMAAWCTSCYSLEQDLKELSKDSNVQVVTIDVDSQTDTQEDLASFQKTYGGNWPHVLDKDSSLLRQFQINSLDTIVILKEGKVVHQSIRPSMNKIREVLNAQS